VSTTTANVEVDLPTVHRLRSLTISVAISFIGSLGGPCFCWWQLTQTVLRNGAGGGLAWFPTHGDELLWLLGFLIFSFPGLLLMPLLAAPNVYLLDLLNVHLGIAVYVPVGTQGYVTIPGDTVIGVGMALMVHMFIWGLLVHHTRKWLYQRQTNS
jgi:hypothetical protein